MSVNTMKGVGIISLLMSLVFLAVYLVLIGVLGCGGDSETNSMQKARTYFKNGEYAAALETYESIIVDYGDSARTGAGWSALRLGLLTEARGYFMAVTTPTPTAYAGRSVAEWALDFPSDALTNATEALVRSPQYAFDLDENFDYRDLIWIQAASHLQLDQKAECVARIQALDPSFNPDMNAANLAELLLAKLTQLGSAAASKRGS